jgi:hypothetical protein
MHVCVCECEIANVNKIVYVCVCVCVPEKTFILFSLESHNNLGLGSLCCRNLLGGKPIFILPGEIKKERLVWCGETRTRAQVLRLIHLINLSWPITSKVWSIYLIIGCLKTIYKDSIWGQRPHKSNKSWFVYVCHSRGTNLT